MDSITNFVDRYIGASLLNKYGITKVVDTITSNEAPAYYDNPLIRLIGTIEDSRFLKKCVSAKQLLIDKLLVCFAPASVYLMFKTDSKIQYLGR